MGHYEIKKGIDLPIVGKPEQIISEGNAPQKVALLGDDYVGMKSTMAVKTGDKVKIGQTLFTDKKMPIVRYTSPGTGTVVEINRGEKRRFISIVIALDDVEDEIRFRSYSEKQLETLGREQVIEQLLESGLWTALRTRPFSKVANPETKPHSIFVTAMDTNALAPSIELAIGGHKQNFITGLRILSKLTDGKMYVCKAHGTDIPIGDVKSVSVEEFEGPHPAGNVGTHIHFLDPVSRSKTVWHIQAQDVVAIGLLFLAGDIDVNRVASLSGPSVSNPRVIRTRLGAAVADLTAGELQGSNNRIISGPILSGYEAVGFKAYLGRYHQQIAVLPEETERFFLGWLRPGLNFFSVKKVFLSALFPGKKYNLTTGLNGSERAIVPIGSYEKVMPLDIQPTFLLRALWVNDLEEAENLGCLELDEEDLALCTFVCPSKNDYGPILRRNLNLIEKEG